MEALCRIGIAWRGIGRGGPFVIVGRITQVNGVALHLRHLDGIEDLACLVGKGNLYLITAEPKIGVQEVVAAVFGIGFAGAVHDHIAVRRDLGSVREPPLHRFIGFVGKPVTGQVDFAVAGIFNFHIVGIRAIIVS